MIKLLISLIVETEVRGNHYVFPESRPLSPISRISKSKVENPQDDVDPTAERYWTYVNDFVPDSILPTLEPTFWSNVNSYIPPLLLKEPRLNGSRESMKSEVLQLRHQALKQSVVDYILMDPEECRRLKIQKVQRTYQPHLARAPVPWHTSVVQAKRHMEHCLFIGNPMMTRLVLLFEKFKNMRIVDFGALTVSNFPMTLDDFQNILRNQCTTFRQRILTEWLPQVATVFFENKAEWYGMVNGGSPEDPDAGFVRLDNFFKSVAALMSNQLWSLVQASLNDVESFFKQFRHGSSELSLFTLVLKVQQSQIRFEPSFQDIDAALSALLNEITLTVSKLPRIETKLFASMAKEEVYLPSVNAVDVVRAKERVLKAIVSKNAVAAQRHLSIYDKFKGLMTQRTDKQIEDFLREKHELLEYGNVRL